MAARALNILHFSTADLEGGSARSAYRIHSGLRQRGHRSRMFVRYRASRDPDVDVVAPGNWAKADRYVDALTRRLALQYLYFPSGHRLKRHPWTREADILQLYNTHGSYLSHRILPALAAGRPVVWRLSDLWPLTGHCAYPGGCGRWQTGCGSCPDLATYPPLPFDTTAMLWGIKRATYRRLASLTIVAPSSWSEQAARRSPLFAGLETVRIPNGLDLARFQPGSRDAARTRFGIPAEAACILFSAHVAIDNPRKGTHFLEQALRMLPAGRDIRLLVAGQGAEKWRERIPYPVIPLGFVTDDDTIRAANLAADLTVLPSTVENLPNTLLEALACGLPVIAFNAGGIADAIRHNVTGLLVEPNDPGALAAAIEHLAGDPAKRRDMAHAARALAERDFSETVELDRIEALYQRILADRPGN
jgi:glycosyltransferase involved in cell wall biosynthesis